MSALVDAIFEMSSAHQSHQPDRYSRPGLWGCSGRSDPLTGHFCQFKGDANAHVEHRKERIQSAVIVAGNPEGKLREVEAVLRDGSIRSTRIRERALKVIDPTTFDLSFTDRPVDEVIADMRTQLEGADREYAVYERRIDRLRSACARYRAALEADA